MEVIERRSYTRITLALDVVGKIKEGRWKGYHELATVKHRIDLYDTIRIEPAERLSVECSDPKVPCDERNICWKAVTLLQKKYRINRQVRIVIEKNIPVMGGLAGGSANAATTLLILNDLWNLKLSVDILCELGRILGMDVPYYFTSGTALDTEAKGIIEPLPTYINLNFVLAVPEFGVSTKEAYSNIDYSLIGKKRELTQKMVNYFLENNRQGVVSSIHNDFEVSVFAQYPRLKEIKKELLDAGCEAAALSGSGSTLFGVVEDREQAESIRKKINCCTITASTFVS